MSSYSSILAPARKKIKMTTVEFDVGGTNYKVSKSLLEMYPDTMLASLASPRWKDEMNDGESKPIFIERNGERFQYVLDYMRDNGKVNLPASVSRDAVISDLEYFGFENVKTDGDFFVNCPSPRFALDMLNQADAVFLDISATLEEMSATLIQKQVCLDLAQYCFAEIRRSGNSQDVRVHGRVGCLEIFAQVDGWREEFDSVLRRVGMELESVRACGEQVFLFSFSFF